MTLTDKQKKDIETLFWRGLRSDEVVVDNRDATIGNELGLSEGQVCTHLQKMLRFKYNK